MWKNSTQLLHGKDELGNLGYQLMSKPIKQSNSAKQVRDGKRLNKPTMPVLHTCPHRPNLLNVREPGSTINKLAWDWYTDSGDSEMSTSFLSPLFSVPSGPLLWFLFERLWHVTCADQEWNVMNTPIQPPEMCIQMRWDRGRKDNGSSNEISNKRRPQTTS